jgi:hypothetical protein
MISTGTEICVTDAVGKVHERRAVTGVVMGDDFPIVWACREEEWQLAATEGRPPRAVPWPAEDVRIAQSEIQVDS